MRVESVSIGRPGIMLRAGRQFSTAINRRAVDGPIRLTETGFEGDRVSDERVHGGPDRAACAFPLKHYAYFAGRLGRELPIPSFGENLTITGLLESETAIGDVFRIGKATVQVTSPRMPCAKLAAKHNSPELPGWIRETGYSGFYFRALHEGEISAGDTIQLIDRPHPHLTVERLLWLMASPQSDLALREELAGLPPLAASWRERFARRDDDDAE